MWSHIVGPTLWVITHSSNPFSSQPVVTLERLLPRTCHQSFPWSLLHTEGYHTSHQLQEKLPARRLDRTKASSIMFIFTPNVSLQTFTYPPLQHYMDSFNKPKALQPIIISSGVMEALSYASEAETAMMLDSSWTYFSLQTYDRGSCGDR